MNAINKYKIRTDISKRIGPFTVYRIEALREFGSVKKGELGLKKRQIYLKGELVGFIMMLLYSMMLWLLIKL